MTTLTHTQARVYLHAAADGRLAAPERAVLDEHLTGCVQCRAFAQDLDRLEAALPRALRAHLEARAAPRSLAGRVQARLKGQTMKNRLPDLVGFALGAGALVIIAAVFAWAIGGQSLTPAGYPEAESTATPLPTLPPQFSPSPDFTQQPLRSVPVSAFDGVGELIGHSLASSDGQGLVVTLLWQNIAVLDGTIMLFVQVADSAGAVLAQSDSTLALGAPGQTMFGQYAAFSASLTLPVDLPPGEYRLSAGLYNAADGARLPAHDEQGRTLDQIELGTFLWPLPAPTATPLPAPPTPCESGCPEFTATLTPFGYPAQPASTLPYTFTPLPTLTATPTPYPPPPNSASPLPFSTDLSATPPPFATPAPAFTPCQVGCPEPTATPLPPYTPTPLPFSTDLSATPPPLDTPTPGPTFTPCQVGCPDPTATPLPTNPP